MQNENEPRKTNTISVYVANKPGVLARIAQVFARRGYNIESLVVSPVVDTHFSRMTITMKGHPDGLDQIIQQTGKLIDVVRCVPHAGEDSVVKEMALIKIAAREEDRTPALQVADHFGAKTVDLSESSMILQVTGNSDKLDAMIRLLSRFRIVELIRTGKVVMARGEEAT
jgi:acetolactate synthase-1/3 small subunit